MSEIITLNVLSQAISNRLGIEKMQAWKVACFILDLFGYDDRIIDNILEPEDRQLFYFLESEGIVTTGREVTLLYNGREWLTHYWELNKSTIVRYAYEKKRKEGNYLINKNNLRDIPQKNVYSNLSDEVWFSRKPNRKSPVGF
jgi:hypothetical protein